MNNSKTKRYFLQWVLLSLIYATIAFFAHKLHVFETIWQIDNTYVTSIIAAVFVATCLYLGFSTWRADTNPTKANADANVGRNIAYIVVLLGILGTVKGLMFMIQDLGHLDLKNIETVIKFMVTVIGALSTAFYATYTGIIASIGITILNTNLEYALDVGENENQKIT